MRMPVVPLCLVVLTAPAPHAPHSAPHARPFLQIREGMRMMGFSDWALFSSWYLVYAILFAFVAVLIAIICKLSMFPNSSIVIVSKLNNPASRHLDSLS